MRFLENKIPPPVVALVFGTLMWLISGEVILFDDVGLIRIILMLLSIAAGSFFSLSGVLAFRAAHTTVNPLKPETASSLVKSGIYKVSRNPMYVGFALFLFSWALYLGSFWSIAGVLGFVLYINRFQIIPEERAMTALFGREFEAYKKTVRRWL